MQISFSVAELAEKLHGEVLGDGRAFITGLAAAAQAKAGDLTFADKERFLLAAERSDATAILVPSGFESGSKILIRVKDPRVAMAKALPLFHVEKSDRALIHETAVIDPSAVVDPTAHIGAHCRIGAGVEIGSRTVLMGNVHVDDDCLIGDDTRLHPNVVLYKRTQIGNRVTIHAGSVIGSDGYGYVLDQGRHCKVLQVGHIEIHDDVEIGANSAIDRGALGATIIGEGTKIDNLVHVAHNVVMGRHCLIMGQVGFAGSTVLGDYVVVASQSGIAGHLKLGTQSTVGAKSGVMRDIPDGETVLGYPAAPDKQAKRQWIGVGQLPDLIRRVKDLEKSRLLEQGRGEVVSSEKKIAKGTE